MVLQELSDNAPGRLVPYDQRPYYSPDPLPPETELQFEGDFYELLSEATFWLGKLSGFSRTTEFAPVLYTSLLRKEAMESAEIEGADIDYNALYSFETRSLDNPKSDGDPVTAVDETKDVQEVLNYERALENGINALDRGDEISTDLLHILHETLLTDVPDDRRETDTIGAFKTVPNHLGEFVPPVPSVVDGLMDALLTYIRTGGSYHPLIDIALTHYQFETIHPYGDGNGRLGRLLITLQLHNQEYLEQPTLYLSEYFNRYKETYVDRMTAVRKYGEWEAWIEFFVTGIRHQAEESLLRSQELYTLQQEYELEYGDNAAAYAQLACTLFEQPYLTAAVVQNLLDVTGPTAYRALDRLEEEGVLEETTGKERNREYRAREIFEILERPPRTY
ncbi:filamentation induced by cAMP protein fic (plasmid) [Halostagnicola larsenii XH-48]|uniref:Filamentation induced by cAMP protein fic n=1 Tax=Halostagnicola larsenii XH-48 TaxID=797299 RepID=W0JY79_9EURY|nr:Fic family protein [Halostagnicola larsenii]AHG01963.1 filamentation induced by cAMP protein fic [Halostagnicola larsenii XH-48]